MEVPLRQEVLDAISGLGLERVFHGHPLQRRIMDVTKPLRTHIVEREGNVSSKPLSQGTFWDITHKYRLDIFQLEIPNVLNQLAYAAGLAKIYVPMLAKPVAPYIPKMADRFFWYHIDLGTRTVSSVWDRVALLLDLAFELSLERECTLKTIMRELPKREEKIIKVEAFKQLKRFREVEFLEVEGRSTLGSRHEVTHVILPSTRFLHHFLNTHSKQPGKVPVEDMPEERLEFLVRHHRLLMRGVGFALDLIEWRWPGG